MELINKTLPLYIDKSGNVVRKLTEEISVCNINQLTPFIIWGFWLLVLLLILLFRKQIKFKLNNVKGNMGYLKIWMILENRKIKEKLIKIDEFKKFIFKKASYNLDMMHEFILGYDKNNIPIFLYDKQFILPLKIDRVKISEEIRKMLTKAGIKEPDEEWIQAVTLRIDASTYNMAWDRKLMKDLYDASKENKMDIWKWIMIGIMAIVIFILIQTGALETFLNNLQNFNK